MKTNDHGEKCNTERLAPGAGVWYKFENPSSVCDASTIVSHGSYPMLLKIGHIEEPQKYGRSR